MHRLELSELAAAQLHAMIAELSLPSDTRDRARKSLRPLMNYPLSGPALSGSWQGFRFILGPWSWMILVYVVLKDPDRVVVVSIEDARSSSSATNER